MKEIQTGVRELAATTVAAVSLVALSGCESDQAFVYEENQATIIEALDNLGPEDLYEVEITGFEIGEVPSPDQTDDPANTVPSLIVNYNQAAGEWHGSLWEPLPVSDDEAYEVSWLDPSIAANLEKGHVSMPVCGIDDYDPHIYKHEGQLYCHTTSDYPSELGIYESAEQSINLPLDAASDLQFVDLKQSIIIGLSGAEDYDLVGRGSWVDELPTYKEPRYHDLGTVVIRADANGELFVEEFEVSDD